MLGKKEYDKSIFMGMITTLTRQKCSLNYILSVYFRPSNACAGTLSLYHAIVSSPAGTQKSFSPLVCLIYGCLSPVKDGSRGSGAAGILYRGQTAIYPLGQEGEKWESQPGTKKGRKVGV